MTAGRKGRRIEWRRGQAGLTTSIVDIDVALAGVVFYSPVARLDGFGARRTSLSDYAIEGVVRLPTAEGGAPEASAVYLSGYWTGDRLDRDEDFDQRSVCYIASDAGLDQEWRTSIFIEGFLFRRLVELYATRRIDAARLSILLKVRRSLTGEIDVPTLVAPPLRSGGEAHRRHSRGHLMSLETALAGETRFKPAILFQSGAARASRRSAHAQALEAPPPAGAS